MSKAQELVVCKNFRLVRKLGTGAFGEIYLAENRTNPQERYAAKLEETSSKFPQLYFQAKMYKYLHSFGAVAGVPRVHAVTTEGQYNVMLMDLLGPSLEDLFVEQNKKMSVKSVLMLAEQMVDRLELLHEKNILHRDIKPDNFLMGVGKHAHLVYIVDFGLSKKYIQDNKHIPYKEGKELTGTARYASINTHMGIEQSRRDDIESVGYVLMYLLRGILPWQNMKAKDTKTKYKLIMERKIGTPAEFLCKGFPNEFALFINYAKGLKFDEKPDYKYLKSLIAAARKNNFLDCDFVYDWTNKQTYKEESTKEEPKRDPPTKEEIKKEYSSKEEMKKDYLTKEEFKKDLSSKIDLSSKMDPLKKVEQEFQVNGALIKPRELSKPTSSNKIGGYKNGGLLSNAGLQTIATKITAPKISVIKR